MFTIDGDSLVEKQTGGGFECTHVRKGDGNTLNMVTGFTVFIQLQLFFLKFRVKLRYKHVSKHQLAVCVYFRTNDNGT